MFKRHVPSLLVKYNEILPEKMSTLRYLWLVVDVCDTLKNI